MLKYLVQLNMQCITKNETILPQTFRENIKGKTIDLLLTKNYFLIMAKCNG